MPCGTRTMAKPLGLTKIKTMNNFLSLFQIRWIIVFLGFFLTGNLSSHVMAQSKIEYDIVLIGGRVIDPETKLDEVKNIGIRNGQIVDISSDLLVGKENIDVSGLVVAPGFIDMHIHGITNQEQEYQARDGVTTALELEFGIPLLSEWHKLRKSKALINYGASASWIVNRTEGMPDSKTAFDQVLQLIATDKYRGLPSMITLFSPTFTEGLADDQIVQMLENVKRSLADGGIGIGVPVGYTHGASREEIFRLYQLAGELQVPIFTHVRSGGTMAIQQAISDAVLTNAPLHIVHINSMAGSEIGLAIEMVQTAANKGFDITTELYPYTAGSTGLETAIFDDGWQERLGIDYHDLQWVATGERLTKETFEKYRKEGGMVVVHSMQPEWISLGIASKDVIIASDGMPYAKLAHPRTAGTFSRVLGKYVREEQLLSLTEAIEKMTLLPAKRLEIAAPMMRYKGRIQVGCNADITIFDPEAIKDKATFEEGLEFSEGVRHVLVNGTFVVKNGETVEGVFPGKPIYGKYKK